MSRRFLQALALGLSLTAAHAGPSNSPDTFVRHLYAGFATKAGPVPFRYPQARDVADANLLELLRRDRDASNGEIGALDYDPICQCQAWENLTIDSVRTISQSQTNAIIDVAFNNFTGRNRKHLNVRFDLVVEGDQWKIHDIHSHDAVSLVALFRNATY
jgi:hypothetical protein